MYGRDKTKKDSYMMKILMKMFGRGELNKDYILQRQSGQFDVETRDGLIASVLRSEDIDPIKLCEQITGENSFVIWLIDGLQRVTTCDDFLNGKFRMGRNLMKPFTYYQKNGEIVEYDMRGKSWSDLPEELQDRFENFSFDYVKHLDCTDEDIAYHIARYNRSAKMNANQKGILYMYKIAGCVKNISQHNRFFLDCGDYTSTEKKKGVVDRIVNETIMLIYHLDDWKRGKAMNVYLNNNAKEEEFKEFDDELNRLTEFIDLETTGKLFNSKNSLLWFWLYHEFLTYGIEDEKFDGFLKAFIEELHSKKFEEYENMSFEEYSKKKSTKDRAVIVTKMDMLEKLLKKYLHIEENEDVEVVDEIEAIDSNDDEDLDETEFVRKYANPDVTDEDINNYYSSMEYCIKKRLINKDHQLLNMDNEKTFLALLAYAEVNQKEDLFDSWLRWYAITHRTVTAKTPKDNYIAMVKSLEKYISSKKVATA